MFQIVCKTLPFTKKKKKKKERKEKKRKAILPKLSVL